MVPPEAHGDVCTIGRTRLVGDGLFIAPIASSLCPTAPAGGLHLGLLVVR
jgi:hypothetical protein